MKVHQLGTNGDRRWRDAIVERHPSFAAEIRGTWLKTATAELPKLSEIEKDKAAFMANDRVRRLDEKMYIKGCKVDVGRLMPHRMDGFLLSCDDYELRERAEGYAKFTTDLLTRRGAECYSIFESICDHYGVKFPSIKKYGLEPVLNRVACASWWRRQLRKLQARTMEEIARDLRMVNQRKQIYCSEFNVNRRKLQKARNKKLLEGLKATNDSGQSFTLQELSDKSTSKPENRRNELMVRIRGFQEVAERHDHKLLFVTVTCPSEFHAYSGSKENAKYTSKTVRDSGGHLGRAWSRLRAYCARNNVKGYGFRVAEPHHDGTVHYHFLLFVRDEVSKRFFSGAFKRYYLEAFKPNERGARKHRVTIRSNLPASAAAGYIAKYISKNIDGFGVDKDLYGHESKTSSQRIEAWASTHGIRQFQQIGGPSVTVWRELRRLQYDGDTGLGKIQAAADAADWAAYVELMGGAFVARDSQPVRPHYQNRIDEFTGEMLDSPVSRYGDEAKGRIVGVTGIFGNVVTRCYRWVIEWVRKESSSIVRGGVGCVVSDAELEYFGEPPPLILSA